MVDDDEEDDDCLFVVVMTASEFFLLVLPEGEAEVAAGVAGERKPLWCWMGPELLLLLLLL